MPTLRLDSRRLRHDHTCVLAALTLLTLTLHASSAAAKFDLNTVAERADALAREPFRDVETQVPDWLLKITYDQWRNVRFRPEHALWRTRKLPFEVQFFHPGLFYNRIVVVNTVDSEGVHPIAFSPSLFDYNGNNFGSQVPQDLGFAGLRLHYPINRRDYKDEVAVFLGASYFRAVGKDLVFGLSARGLAIDTALPSGEEFPFFREFWLLRPTAQTRSMTLFALLDSPSLTGAYRFVITPGEETIVDVNARLFFRKKVGKLGIAPLTSMFLRGENGPSRVQDYRPEVHDSDGLLVATESGEWIWRPLDNPAQLRVSAFASPNPKGFGLLQRDRDFDHYQDLETRPDLRPSVWIKPRKTLAQGHVELVEIPTQTGTNDNIVAAWVPEPIPAPGEPFEVSYRVHWYHDDLARPPAGRAIATRHDRGTVEGAHRLVIDFAGPHLAALPATANVRGVVTVGRPPHQGGQLLDQQVVKNTDNGSWRLVFQVRSTTQEALTLRALLRQGAETLTETWTYTIGP
jgi:periplasmic glucans biosynthesis protein